MRTVDQYVLQVLADRWAAPSRVPSLLDVSRRGDGIAEDLARAGFRVTRIALSDSSLESVSERLAGLSRHFDAVVCREVLDLVDDWREVIGRAARRLRPGGVLIYGTSAGGRRRWLSRFMSRWLASDDRATSAALLATLRRLGLAPRELTTPGGETARDASTAYMGHSILRAERPEPAARMRWDFTGTGERWIAGVRG
jgi:SAM-dependent methyltransferase